MNVYFRIKECVDEFFRGEDFEIRGVDEEGLLNVLKEWGIVDDVMSILRFEGLERELVRIRDRGRVEIVEEIFIRGI